MQDPGKAYSATDIHIRSRVRQLTLILLNKAQKLPGGYLFSPDLLTNIRHEWTPALNSRFFQGGGKFHKSSFRGGGMVKQGNDANMYDKNKT